MRITTEMRRWFDREVGGAERMSWLCRIGIHDWSKWKTLHSEEHGFSYWKIVQMKECLGCKKQKITVRIKG